MLSWKLFWAGTNVKFQKVFGNFTTGIHDVLVNFLDKNEPLLAKDLQEIVRSVEDQNNSEMTFADVLIKRRGRWTVLSKDTVFKATAENRLSVGWDTKNLKPLGQYQSLPKPYIFFIETEEKKYKKLLPTIGWMKI